MGSPSCWWLAGYRRRRRGERWDEQRHIRHTLNKYLYWIVILKWQIHIYGAGEQLYRERKKRTCSHETIRWSERSQEPRRLSHGTHCCRDVENTSMSQRFPTKTQNKPDHVYSNIWEAHSGAPCPHLGQTTAICFFIQPTGATQMAKPCYCAGEADNIVQDCFEQADWFGTHVTFAWGRGWGGGGGTSALLLTAHHATHHQQSHLIIT